MEKTVSTRKATNPGTERECRVLHSSAISRFGYERYLAMEVENRSLLDDLAGFADAIWA
jgi:hypothetical protein